MTALIVPCPHCPQRSRLDSERLPDGPASFACPGCKQKVVVDKRQLLRQQSPEAAAAAPQAAASPQAAPAPPQAPASASSTPAAPAILDSTAPSDRRFAKLPDDASFPSGIILGEDEVAVAEVQKILADLGSEVDRVSSPDVARQLIINEQPELCVYVGGEVPAAPYEAMGALTGLPSSFRRRLFLVLIADNLKTLDGSAAFLHQVNMILARQDFAQFGAALYSGLDYHERLYRPFVAATERKGAI